MIGKCNVCPELRSERDYLRAQVEKLQDQVVRLERVRECLPELAPVPSTPLPPMPPEVLGLIEACADSAAMRSDLENRAKRSYRQHKSWEPAISMLNEALGVE